MTQSILFYTIGDFKGSGGTAPALLKISEKSYSIATTLMVTD